MLIRSKECRRGESQRLDNLRVMDVALFFPLNTREKLNWKRSTEYKKKGINISIFS